MSYGCHIISLQDWQSLFGIYCSNNIFIINDLTSYNNTVRLNSSQWVTASHLQAILLGRASFNVEVTFPHRAEDYDCRVLLNVGFKSYLYLVLQLSVKGTHLCACWGSSIIFSAHNQLFFILFVQSSVYKNLTHCVRRADISAAGCLSPMQLTDISVS